MAPVPNPSVLFNAIPKGEPTLDTFKYDTSQTIDLDQALNGGLIIQLVSVSVDPYMRGRMRPAEIKSYSPAFPLHQPLTGHGVAKVIKSEEEKYPVGTHVYGFLPYTAYIYYPKQKDSTDPFGLAALTPLPNEEGLPWSTYVGAAGMPGKTAYMGWKEISEAKKGETAFVSAGSGAVGSLVIQIAKSQGLTVITSAGSDEKVEFCKSIGADIAFNYKTQDAKEVFQKYGKGIDVNWVNVGGASFETELDFMNPHGRLIGCGWISGYNGESFGVKNMFKFVTNRLKMQGFIVSDFEAKYGKEFYDVVPKALATGKYKFHEVHYDGLEKLPQAFIEMLSGKAGHGKVVIDVSK